MFEFIPLKPNPCSFLSLKLFGRKAGIDSPKLCYNVRHLEKGEKVTTTVEILYDLDLSQAYVKTLFDKLKPNEPLKEKLFNVVGQEERDDFKMYFWGDISI